MNIKYQIFVSSTYRDLMEERVKIFESLMSRHIYIPVGMENFEASNRPPWNLIKQRIDECDYMLVIVGDQAGSSGPEGIPFTEMEYDYARQKKIPVVALLKSDISPVASNPKEIENARLVLAFREKCKLQIVKYWKDANDLANHAAVAVEALVRNSPKSGWIRAKQTAELPFNLGKDKSSYRLAGKWHSYFIENDGSGPKLIEEEVIIRQDGLSYDGTHKCITEKRGLFHFQGYLSNDEFVTLFSFYKEKFEYGGVCNFVVSRQGQWLEGFSTWRAWPSGVIDCSRYILHKVDGINSENYRIEALRKMAIELEKAKL